MQSSFVIQKGMVIYPPLFSVDTQKKSSLEQDSFFHLLTVSRLVKRKGHRRVLEALALLKKEGKGDHLFYTIAGEGPEPPFF